MFEEFAHFLKCSKGPNDDDTSGTSDFDRSNDNDPDDCYCESFDLERLSPDIQLCPADEYYLDNIIEWKIQTILEGYPDEQPSTEEYNKISNYVKNETPKMLDDTRIIMYDNDQPIGMIIAYQKDQDWFIDDIFLIPEFRHKGIGRMILGNEISNHDQLALWVYKSNIHAISLYESLGFKVEEAIKERQMMRLRKTDVEMIKGWRVTYQGIGIYEALKNAMFTQTGSSDAWMSFINSDACNWLPKPPSYGNDNKSFFTEEGFNRFNELVLPIIAQYIDQTKIYIEEIMVPTNQIVYSDEFQFVTSDGKCKSHIIYKEQRIFESGSFAKYAEGVDLNEARGPVIKRTNQVYTNGGSIQKVDDFPFNKAYFGSPHKLNETLKLEGPLFITPYPGIASIFAVRPQSLGKYGVPVGVGCNRDYDEWNVSLKDTLLQKPLRELHVHLDGDGVNIKPVVELVSGYIYTIDITPEIKDHIYQSERMNKTLEFCIDKLDSVTFSNIQKINVRMSVDSNKRGQTIQEAALTSKKRNSLKDSDFALVYTDANKKKIRKYPVHDETHVKSAAHFFPKGVPDKYKGRVARRILREARKYKLDTSGWKNVQNCKTLRIQESVEEWPDILDDFFMESHKTHFKRTMERLDYDPRTQTIKTSIRVNKQPLRLKMIIDNRDGDDTCFIHFDKKKNKNGELVPDFKTGEIHIARKLLKTKTWNAMFSVKHEEGHAWFYANVFSDGKPTKAKLRVMLDQEQAIDMIINNKDVLSEHGMLPDEYVADKYAAEKTSKIGAIKALDRIKDESYMRERNKAVSKAKKDLDELIEKRNSISEQDIEKYKQTIVKLGNIIADLMTDKKDYEKIANEIPAAKKIIEQIDDIGKLAAVTKISQLQQNYIDKLNIDRKIEEFKKARDIAEKSQDCYLAEMELRKTYVNKFAK